MAAKIDVVYRDDYHADVRVNDKVIQCTGVDVVMRAKDFPKVTIMMNGLPSEVHILNGKLFIEIGLKQYELVEVKTHGKDE